MLRVQAVLGCPLLQVPQTKRCHPRTLGTTTLPDALTSLDVSCFSKKTRAPMSSSCSTIHEHSKESAQSRAAAEVDPCQHCARAAGKSCPGVKQNPCTCIISVLCRHAHSAAQGLGVGPSPTQHWPTTHSAQPHLLEGLLGPPLVFHGPWGSLRTNQRCCGWLGLSGGQARLWWIPAVLWSGLVCCGSRGPPDLLRLR